MIQLYAEFNDEKSSFKKNYLFRDRAPVSRFGCQMLSLKIFKFINFVSQNLICGVSAFE